MRLKGKDRNAMIKNLLIIGGSAAVGAWIRWGLGIICNPIFPVLPLGTLVANLSGGFLIGGAIGVMSSHTFLSEGVRLALMTGFLGGLTTFSTFSAEVVTMFLRGEYMWASLSVFFHLGGSLLFTLLGLFFVKLFLKV
jgi:fluoride exporter